MFIDVTTKMQFKTLSEVNLKQTQIISLTTYWVGYSLRILIHVGEYYKIICYTYR